MKLELGERQSIAWFRLSEFVNRGEKERALSLLRLLTHSLEDRAYIKKLSAEILASFDDRLALDEYIHAAHLYRLQGDLVEAVSIYEFLTVLRPDASEYFEKVIALFEELGNKEKVLQYQKQLCELFLMQGRVDKGIELFETVAPILDEVEKLFFFQKIFHNALVHRYAHRSIVTSYLEKTLEGLLRFAGEAELNKFLVTVQAQNSVWHKDALLYLENFK